MLATNSILALDVGDVRVGVAIASKAARLPRPLLTLDNNAAFLDRLGTIIADESVELLVVGYPRGLNGQITRQTKTVETFAESLQPFGLRIQFQDEALTSAKAKAELESRGKLYHKGDIDALAATYILEDYLNNKDSTS